MKLRQSKSLFLLIIFLIFSLGLLIYLNRQNCSICYFSPQSNPSSLLMLQTKTTEKISGPTVQIKETLIPVELATSSETIKQGLSGRAKLDQDKGMLFIFKRPDYYRFWMPDMNFPLDIIWLEEDRVAGFYEGASPDFDPLQPVFYQSPTAVRLVLEVNAGFVAQHQIKVGDPVVFSQIE